MCITIRRERGKKECFIANICKVEEEGEEERWRKRRRERERDVG